jgi:hypothetical protein
MHKGGNYNRREVVAGDIGHQFRRTQKVSEEADGQK